MPVFRNKCVIRITDCWVLLVLCLMAVFCGADALAQTPALQSARRIYVEPFTTREGSEKLREDVTAELRKQSSVAVVGSDAAADLVLGGGGEVWVKGYVSLNPRSGRTPSSGKPVYAGYLSVELRNKKGRNAVVGFGHSRRLPR